MVLVGGGVGFSYVCTLDLDDAGVASVFTCVHYVALVCCVHLFSH